MVKIGQGRCGIVYRNEDININLRSRLKNRILAQGQGGAEFQTGGILMYVEDLKRGPNAEIGSKDIFEMASHLGFHRQFS
mgnify:CR=1 FL=1